MELQNVVSYCSTCQICPRSLFWYHRNVEICGLPSSKQPWEGVAVLTASPHATIIASADSEADAVAVQVF